MQTYKWSQVLWDGPKKEQKRTLISSHYLHHFETFINTAKYVNPTIWICGGTEGVLRREQKVSGRPQKPDMTQFKKIASSCAIGFAIMGGIGYIVKLLFIPINIIILS